MTQNPEPEQHEHKSAHALLEVAIQIAQQGDRIEARQLLRSYLETRPQDERAWAWYVDTFPDDEKRLRILQVYLKQHPHSDFAQKAIHTLRNRPKQPPGASHKETAPASNPAGHDGWPAMLRPVDMTAQEHEGAATQETEVQPPAAARNNETRLLIIAIVIILVTITLAVVWSLVR